jgi:hypothetical protein
MMIIIIIIIIIIDEENGQQILKRFSPALYHFLPLSLCFFLTQHHAMKAYWGSEGVAPLILWPWR